jgi:ribosome-associated protein
MSEAQRPLCLDQFLKLAGIVGSGGQAKLLIQGGEIKLNGVVETRRRKKLSRGDRIEAGGKIYSADEYL